MHRSFALNENLMAEKYVYELNSDKIQIQIPLLIR